MPESTWHPLRILLLDDDQGHRLIMEHIFHGCQGVRISACSQLADDSSLLGDPGYQSELFPHAIVVNYGIALGGAIAIQKVKSNQLLAHVPLIIVTGLELPSALENLSRLADLVLQKPMGLAAYERLVAEIVRYSRSRAQTHLAAPCDRQSVGRIAGAGGR